jgi:uncharacterized protein
MQQILLELLRGHDPADLVLFAMPLIFIPLASLRLRLRRRRAGGSTGEFPRRQIYLRNLVLQALLIGGIAWMWLLRGRPFAALGLDMPLTGAGALGLIAAAAITLSGLVALLYGLAKRPTRIRLLERHRATLMAPRTRAELLLFVPVAVTAGLFEELLYRGFLFWFLVPSFGLAAAITASALLFGLGHIYLGLRGMLATGTVGLTLAVLYAASGSLWWIMALHAAVDLHYFVTGVAFTWPGRGTASGPGVVNATIL